MDTSNIIRDSFSPQLLRSARFNGIENLLHAFRLINANRTITMDFVEELPTYWFMDIERVVRGLDEEVAHKNYVRAYSWKLFNSGAFDKLPCQTCGEPEVEMHHHDYYIYPGDVMWLCRRCHLLEHMRLDAMKLDPPVKCSNYEVRLLKLAVAVEQFNNQDGIVVASVKDDESRGSFAHDRLAIMESLVSDEKD